MSLIKNFTIGSDPEMFLFSEQNNEYVPVCGLIGGTKEEPLALTDKGHFVQEDNVAVEFCIPPCKTEDEFVENILFTKSIIEKKVNELGLTLRCTASAMFNPELLNSEQAKTFGCDPDFNAYTLEENSIDKTNVDPNLRSCGFHIHVGYDNHSPETSVKLVKAFDLFVGLPSILLDPDKDRRKLYGKPGCFRLKPKYGVEMRLLSSYFLSSEELIRWVYKQTIKAINFVNIGGIITNEEEIIKAIMESDLELAEEIIEEYQNLELV